MAIILVNIVIINPNTCLSTGSNQPPRFLNYFFSTYLLIYEDMPVGKRLCCFLSDLMTNSSNTFVLFICLVTLRV